MKVKEIMTENPAYATIETSLHDVAQMMSEQDCGVIPVVESGGGKKPVGVITDRDLALRTIAHNKNPLNMIAGEAMTDKVITIGPDMSVEDCIDTMESNQIRRVLVVDEKGDLLGIVAQADIARKAPAFETAELVKDISMQATG
jgi:CBS domain-containing protein